MVNSFKGKLVSSVLLILLGIVIGVLFSVYLFAIDVDLLSVPYLNKGVELTQDIDVVQNGHTIHIPKGSQMILTRRMPSSNEYCILINSYWDDESLIEAIESKPKYFELKEADKK